MNAQQAENLRILIRHMEGNVKRMLFMDVFFICDAPACALGEATMVPQLAAQLDHEPGCSTISNREKVFGDEVRLRLFGQAPRNAWGRTDVTPQEWAIEARRALAEHGYSMDDGFTAFKAKLLQPVELESVESR